LSLITNGGFDKFKITYHDRFNIRTQGTLAKGRLHISPLSILAPCLPLKSLELVATSTVSDRKQMWYQWHDNLDPKSSVVASSGAQCTRVLVLVLVHTCDAYIQEKGMLWYKFVNEFTFFKMPSCHSRPILVLSEERVWRIREEPILWITVLYRGLPKKTLWFGPGWLLGLAGRGKG